MDVITFELDEYSAEGQKQVISMKLLPYLYVYIGDFVVLYCTEKVLMVGIYRWQD